MPCSNIDGEFPVLVLAAGASSRFGSPKVVQTLAGPAGTRVTLLDWAIRQGRLLSDDVRVVCGAWYPLVRFRCSVQPARWVYAENWQDGMAASLAAGVRSLGSGAQGVFVLLADQPLLKPEALKALGVAARCCPDEPVAADYGKRPGVPAYLPRAFWPAVLALQGDRGAGGILAEANAQRLDIPGVHDDIDTPADWRRICELISQTDL